jgi:hypothetical protein
LKFPESNNMTPTAERAIEIVRQLPPPELEKFFDWAEVEIHFQLHARQASRRESKAKRARIQLSMRWLSQNRQNFIGKWVCLDGDKLIAQGTDGLQLYESAIAQGIESPFVEHIVEDKIYGGGIEVCR